MKGQVIKNVSGTATFRELKTGKWKLEFIRFDKTKIISTHDTKDAMLAEITKLREEAIELIKSKLNELKSK